MGRAKVALYLGRTRQVLEGTGLCAEHSSAQEQERVRARMGRQGGPYFSQWRELPLTLEVPCSACAERPLIVPSSRGEAPVKGVGDGPEEGAEPGKGTFQGSDGGDPDLMVGAGEKEAGGDLHGEGSGLSRKPKKRRRRMD